MTYNASLSPAARIRHVCAQIDVIQTQLLRDLPDTPDWYACQFSSIRSELNVALAEFYKATTAFPAEVETSTSEGDRHWHALKAALKTYRDMVGSDPERTHRESSSPKVKR